MEILSMSQREREGEREREEINRTLCKHYSASIIINLWTELFNVHLSPCALLVGMQIGAATMENSMESPQKTKN